MAEIWHRIMQDYALHLRILDSRRGQWGSQTLSAVSSVEESRLVRVPSSWTFRFQFT